jgi:hypothetical protein
MASFVEELISPDSAPVADAPVETTEAPAQEAQSATESTVPQGEATADAPSPEQPTGDQPSDPEFDALLQKIAGEEQWDLNDPTDRAAAEKAAKREQRLLNEKAATDPGQAEAATLTEIERQLFGESEPAQPAKEAVQPQQEQQPPVQPQAPGKYGDIGDEWKDFGDAFTAEMNEWTAVSKAMESGAQPSAALFAKLHQIRHADFIRRLDSVYPVIMQNVQRIAEQITDKRMESQLGDVLGDVRQSVEERRLATAKEQALSDLEKATGFEKIRELYKDEGGKVQMRDPETGKFVSAPNTPLNRILQSNPDILNIEVSRDRSGNPLPPAMADRLTYIARLRAAYRILSAQRVNPQTAQALVDAGRQDAVRRQQDRARQALNSGSGASTRGAGTEAKGLVDELAAHGGGKSFSSLFG